MQDEDIKAAALEAQVDTVLASMEEGMQKLSSMSSALETLNQEADLWEQEAETIDTAVAQLGEDVGKELSETIVSMEKELDALSEGE
jgi:prefoldin subunit 5